MDSKRTALVLIEYQNDFTSKGGTLHDAVKGVMEANNMLQNTVDSTAYEKGYKVITLKDCTAALSAEEQRMATEKNYPMVLVGRWKARPADDQRRGSPGKVRVGRCRDEDANSDCAGSRRGSQSEFVA